MELKQKYGGLALVAGASEGIGEAFTIYLAGQGLDLILIARRKEPLERLAADLINKYKIKVTCINCDLSESNANQKIMEATNGQEISMLVYNAAMSYIGPFEQTSLEYHNKIVFSNMITPMTLIHSCGELMLKKQKGAVIIMASLAGFQGSGFLATYAATKAFCRVLAESLWYEWKNAGVDVIACCAGATSTPNYLRTRPEKKRFLAPPVLTPGEVVEECMNKLGKVPSFIPGRGNRIASFIMQRIFPRKMAINIMGDNTRKMYRL
jgi:short-subunit dehydrogenase